MSKKLTRTGRHSLPVVFMQLFILATGASAQAKGKISVEGRNITFASIFRNIKNQPGLTVFYSNKLIDDSEKGEVYFGVMPDQSKPFKVMTHGGEIKVAGTDFKVSGNALDGEGHTTLLEGGVDVHYQGKTHSLTPGFEAVSSADGKLVKQQGNLERAMAWKNGYFLFENMDVVSDMRSLARWYDVRIVIEVNLPKKRFGGSFRSPPESMNCWPAWNWSAMLNLNAMERRFG